MDVPTYVVHTDGHLRPTLLDRLRRADLIKHAIELCT